MDFLHPDRIVVGTGSDRAFRVLSRIYRPLTDGSYYRKADSLTGSCSEMQPAPLVRTSTKSAELIKHASNAFLAMKISFINSVANVCEAVEADVEEVARGMGLDRRIGPRFLNAGLGYGGSCFPKDLKAFYAISQQVGTRFDLLKEVELVNERQQMLFLKKIRSTLWNLRRKRLAVLGLAFKGGTDDIRESPAINLVSSFLAEGCVVTAYDPAAMPNARRVFSSEKLTFAADPYEAMEDADALVVLTDWPEFARLDLKRAKASLANPIIFDGRNLFDCNDMAREGFTYICIGRPAIRRLRRRVTVDQEGFLVRALVTGAAGFLGSHMVDRLLADGHNVIGGRQPPYRASSQSRASRQRARFEFLEHDITLPFDPGRVDMVFNMASPASPADYLAYGIETLMVGALRHAKHARNCQKELRALPPLLHFRVLWRPRRASAVRNVLGKREPDRTALRLRRGQAIC